MSGEDTSRTRTSSGLHAASGLARLRRLQVVHGPGEGARVVLESSAVVVGRTVEGPLAIADPELSKRHVALEPGPEGWVAVDLGSHNGTFLDGRRCVRAPLPPRAVIRAGASVLLYEDVALPPATELVPESPTLLGPSLAMQRVRGEVKLVAPQPITVLVLGETGVGKERVAEEIHAKSGVPGPLVPVNCAAIAPELAESELFGHAEGAFTGARARAAGLFAAAAEGTLFLDEVGELPLSVQPKLLRALAKGEVRPVGSSETLRVRTRVIAATHRDLQGSVEQGTFRDDLLARLSGWTLTVPPLRARRDDVLPLARRFLARGGAPAAGFDADVAEALLLHDWPYNVRELEQVLAVAAVRAGAGPLRREHLPGELAALLKDRAFGSALPPAAPPLEVLIPRDRPPTREDLEQVLRHAGGNVAQVADFFGKDRRQIYRWAERLGLDPESFRP